jgi:hypothetical protein
MLVIDRTNVFGENTAAGSATPEDTKTFDPDELGPTAVWRATGYSRSCAAKERIARICEAKSA